MKQRKEKALQNAKDRKLTKENFLAALRADCKAGRVSNHIQDTANTNDELINGSDTDIVIGGENTDNTAIATDNADNPATDAENIDNDIANADTSNSATYSKKSGNAVMSDNNTDDPILGNGNTENTVTGETSAGDVPSPLLYGRKTTDPSKVKTSKRHIPIRTKPSEPSIDDPPPDKIATVTVKGHAFDPTDVQVYEIFIQGAPHPKDLEGVEKDQLLEIQ